MRNGDPRGMTMPPAPLTYSVVAHNTSQASENKIHDDAVASRFGFAGGLVPGVDVYGYMTHLPVARWGREWLESGAAECRFAKPVYDGEVALVTASETANGLDLTVESRGELCATGHATLVSEPVAKPSIDSFLRVAERPARPPADEVSLAADTWLGITPLSVTPELAEEYLRGVRETATLYAEEHLVHPVLVLRLCNFALSRNVTLGPWIHVGSKVQNFSPAHVGDELEVRARVTANYAHKGHLFVELDALVLADEIRPIARVAHVAIYRPRQVAAAAAH